MTHISPIVVIVGTRPEAIKMAPVYCALKDAGLPVCLVLTQQHGEFLGEICDLFGIQPDYQLGIMRHGQDLFYVTQAALQKLKELYIRINPSRVIVQGDTTSSMVAALAAFYLHIPVVHIEAGLRTHDQFTPFPEEMNRRVITQLASVHGAPTQRAYDQLIKEGVAPERVLLMGNTVVDALYMVKERLSTGQLGMSERMQQIQRLKDEYAQMILLTMHRRESYGDPIRIVLRTVREFLQQHQDAVCILPVHPNPQVIQAINAVGLVHMSNCRVLDPLAYHEMVYALDMIDWVVTDSGGVQEEAVSLGKKVIVTRERTERMEGVDVDMATLVGSDEQMLLKALHEQYWHTSTISATAEPCFVYGDGHAAQRLLTYGMQDDIHVSPTVRMQVQSEIHINKKGHGMTQVQVNVIGLGYIGLPTAVVLAQAGYRVCGVDIDADKVSAINAGDPVIQEPDLFELLRICLTEQTFFATTQVQAASYHVIAVPTPFKSNKKADLTHVYAAVDMLVPVLKDGDVIIIESTIPVGTTQAIAAYVHRYTGLNDEQVHVAHCPERVLPGNIMHELVHNDRIVGGVTTQATDKAAAVYEPFMQGMVYKTQARIAEMVKLVENSSRDVEVAFAHQVAAMADKAGINPYEVIELANKHPRVNILQPSAGVGGHCIAVDPWFLIEGFPQETILLQAARKVNDMRPLQVIEHIFKVVRTWNVQQAVTAERPCNVALLGLTYKPNVDDLRESPALYIANIVREHATMNLSVCEPHLRMEQLQALYGSAATTLADAVDSADVVVFLVKHDRFKAIDSKRLAGKQVVDVCGLLYDANRIGQIDDSMSGTMAGIEQKVYTQKDSV